MNLVSLQGTTLIDYPGRVAATLFASGCNFRCPYCQNPELVDPDRFPPLPTLAEEAVLIELEERLGFLEGVVLTGGEPTLQEGLVRFVERLREMGYLVKLDTNGSRPEVVSALVEGGRIDYVAVDVKAPPDRYAEFAGVDAALAEVERTIAILKGGRVDYEFRTTVAPGLTGADVEAIAAWIRPSRRYVLQLFRVPPDRTKGLLDPSWAERDALRPPELHDLWSRIRSGFEEGGVRA
jgi:pyruvate formate lyase activating enzyme